jgi:hypothetical protein
MILDEISESQLIHRLYNQTFLPKLAELLIYKILIEFFEELCFQKISPS